MKNLTLIRHADANPQQPFQSDSERNLTDKGRRQVENIAKQLKKLKCLPDYLLCSSAKRAIQTTKILCEQFKINSNLININKSLYLGDLEDTLLALHSFDCQKLFLIGHNPNLSWLAHKLCPTTKSIILPTAGVISLGFDVENWKYPLIQGKLLFFIEPLDK